MNDKKTSKPAKYTCDDYRAEMRLLGIRQQLKNTELSESDKRKLQSEIDQIEQELGLS
ncbi:hypothetical protein [Desulforhopalus sp. 52FAK]